MKFILFINENEVYNDLFPEFHYIDQSQWVKNPPDWIIKHSLEINYHPGDNLLIKGIGRYNLMKKYGFSGYYGVSWFLYRSADNLDNLGTPY